MCMIKPFVSRQQNVINYLVIENHDPHGVPFNSNTTIVSLTGGGVTWTHEIVYRDARFLTVKFFNPNPSLSVKKIITDPPEPGSVSITIESVPPNSPLPYQEILIPMGVFFVD